MVIVAGRRVESEVCLCLDVILLSILALALVSC